MSSQSRNLLTPASVLLLLTFALALGSFFYWAAYTLASNDTAWLARTGQLIIASGKLPEHDVFSWTCNDKDWVLYQWLFEVGLGATFNAGGPRGLWISGLLSALTAGIIYFYILPRQWSRLRIPLPIIFPLLALTLSPAWFFIRPQLISNLFIAIYINACERFRRSGKVNAIAILPVLTIVWANCHPLWLIGLLIPAVYISYHYLRVFLARHKQNEGTATKFQTLAPLLVLLLCAISVLANPYGMKLVDYELYLSGANNFKTVNELRPLFADPPIPFYPFIAFSMLSSVIIAWKSKFVPLPGLILAGFGLLAAISANKFTPVGALLIWPCLGFALSGFRAKGALPEAFEQLKPVIAVTRPVERYLNRKGGARLLILSLILSFACYQTRIPTADFAIVVFTYNDIETMKFLFTHDFPDKRVFNDEPTGSLMIYFNILPVFCDGRVDFYGKEFCDKWLSCINGETGWQDYLAKLSVNEIVIKNSTGLFQELSRSSRWLRAYDNGARSVWLPNNDQGKYLLEQWRSEAAAPGK